jgi:transcriptional regulator with XRE-family HTH domain
MFGASLYSSEYDTLRLWLKNARDKSGLTIREVALRLDVHHSIVGKVEKGDRSLELFEFIAYCEAVNADVGEGFNMAIKASSRG